MKVISEKEEAKTNEKATLADLRKALPYQYATIIANKLENISAMQVRLVFYDQITDPTIVVTVLEEAWRLYEEVKKAKTLREKAV